MKAIYFILLVFLILGCGGAKQGSLITSEKDSTYTTVQQIKRQEIVTVPGDSIKIRIPIIDLSDQPITRRSERATATVRQVNGNLEVDCKCEQYLAQIAVMDQLITTQRELIKMRQETIIEEVKYVPWYYKILSFIGLVAVLYIGVRIGIKIAKPL